MIVGAFGTKSWGLVKLAAIVHLLIALDVNISPQVLRIYTLKGLIQKVVLTMSWSKRGPSVKV